jgi:hypothetical protein
MSVVFAASHPERVSALVLYGGLARVLWAPDYLFGYTEREYRKGLEDGFDAFVTPGGLEESVRSGFPSADEAEVRAWARIFRYGSSPSAAEALDRMNMAIDVREVLPVISASTLVVHQRGDPWVRVEHGRYLAQHIPGAAYVELDGDEHIPTAATASQLLAEMMPFLQEAATREAPEPDKVLTAVLFSDIVGSTSKAAELGDTRWRELLAAHHGRGPRPAGPVPRGRARHGRGWVFRPLRWAGPRDPQRAGDSSGGTRRRPAGPHRPAHRRVRGARCQGDQRPDHQAAPPPGTAGGLIQASHREPPDHAHRRKRVPGRPVEQPLRPIRRPVPGMLSDRPAVPFRQPAHQRTDVLARLQPRLRPRETRPQQRQQLPTLPHAQARAPILAAAAASDSAVLTNCMIARWLPHPRTRDRRGYPAYPQVKALVPLDVAV